MSTPKRRPTPAVYRRRRLAVLLLALLVIGGIVWLAVAQPWQGLFASSGTGEDAPAASATPPAAESSPTPEPTPEASTTPEASATPEPEPTPTACDPEALRVEGVTMQTEYAADQQPQFAIRLSNTGDVDCTLNVGTSTQRFVVTSGEDTWWQSTDCQTEPADMEVTLAAGQTVESQEPVTWDRTRSSVDTCDAESRPAAPGGGASYYLDVEIAGVAAEEPVLFLLY